MSVIVNEIKKYNALDVYLVIQEINITEALLSYNSKLGVEISSLKPAQLNALEVILRGHDVIAAFPTGFGKSLIYEIIPFVNPNACVLVIEPVNVIIQQQLKKLCDLAIFLQKHMNVEDLDKVKKGKFPFIYCHPEFLIGNPEINKLLPVFPPKMMSLSLLLMKLTVL